jgi:hypothetical protein
LVNPSELLAKGITQKQVKQFWTAGPVHMTSASYKKLSDSLLDSMKDLKFIAESAFQVRNLELLPSKEFFVRGLSTLALQGINSDSGGYYQLIDVESTLRMGLPPGITSSGTRNPPEEGDYTGNYQLIYSDSGR